MTANYSKSFYSAQQVGSKRSAEVVVPMVMDLLHPSSIVDIGCGMGTWLSVFRAHGVEDILGVDGNYVELNSLHIPREYFQSHDLKLPLQLDRQFDLVASLEVAEHLPASCAEQFVNTLTALASIVLFSAAIPHQGGTHHVNEQWPGYWTDLFERRGYQVVDGLRCRIWENAEVDWCYAQNILIYARPEAIEANPALKQAWQYTERSQLSLVHPRKYLEQCDPEHITIRRLADWLPILVLGMPKILANAVQRRLK